MNESERARQFVDLFVASVMLDLKQTMAECAAALHVNKEVGNAVEENRTPHASEVRRVSPLMR